jgi:hypothetical protein
MNRGAIVWWPHLRRNYSQQMPRLEPFARFQVCIHLSRSSHRPFRKVWHTDQTRAFRSWGFADQKAPLAIEPPETSEVQTLRRYELPRGDYREPEQKFTLGQTRRDKFASDEQSRSCFSQGQAVACWGCAARVSGCILGRLVASPGFMQ